MLVSHTITFVKALLGLVLRPGDMAVDATAGNGIDTLFLSRAVGPGGRVFAFDVQAEALESTRARLGRENAPDNVTLIHAGHEDLARELPPVAHGALGVVAFNLGYLPGGDPGVATHAATTCAAVDAALPLMRQGGLISLVLYTGHPDGPEEARAVEAHCAAIPQDTTRVMHCTMHNQPSAQVRLLLLEKQ